MLNRWPTLKLLQTALLTFTDSQVSNFWELSSDLRGDCLLHHVQYYQCVSGRNSHHCQLPNMYSCDKVQESASHAQILSHSIHIMEISRTLTTIMSITDNRGINSFPSSEFISLPVIHCTYLKHHILYNLLCFLGRFTFFVYLLLTQVVHWIVSVLSGWLQ